MTAAEIALMIGAVDFTVLKAGLIPFFTGMAGISSMIMIAHLILKNIKAR